MKTLFKNSKVDIDVLDKSVDLKFIIEKMIIGGFPTLLGKKLNHAIDLNRAYIDLLSEVDMSRISNVKRDPVKVQNLLRSIARNTATVVGIKTLESDIQKKDNNNLSRPTIYDYINALKRLMIIEEQPPWNTHIRSSAQLHKRPKYHFTDVSLSVAAVGADCDALFNDLNFTGFLFESLVIHELRVYAQANDAKVYHYQDSYGLEVDAIVQKYNGDWIAFEIKLGTGQIEDAAKNLHKLVSNLDKTRIKPPKSLNIITGTEISYTRPDGINVISIASLGV
jgi:predicted AAA+ superfamily ATPase